MNLVDYLNANEVCYELRSHRPTFTAQQLAAEEHVPGMRVAKPVLVRADNRFILCVLPACCKIDLDALKWSLGAKEAVLADETDMVAVFFDCQLGAEPPLGHLYHLTTIMDKMLEKDVFITFQAGSHEKAVKISMADYKKLESPKVLNFSYLGR